MGAPSIRGINLSYLVDFRQQCPWKNEMRCARIWWQGITGGGTVGESRLQFEDPLTGYPTQLPANRYARTVISSGNFPTGGTWAVDFLGDGDVEIDAGNGIFTTTGYREFQRNTVQLVTISITRTNPADPVRDIWIGERRYYATRDNPRLKEDWSAHLTNANINAIRTMQWQYASGIGNGHPLTQVWQPSGVLIGMKPPWNAQVYNQDVRKREYFTDSGYVQGTPGNNDAELGTGCPFSTILIAAIELNIAYLHICVPHAVNDGQAYVAWVHSALEFIRDFRHPVRNVGFLGTIIIEYSSETWNGSFIQHQYCRDRGQALGLDGRNQFEQGHSFYALRSSQIFATALQAKQTLGLTNRVERLIGIQAGVGEENWRFRSQLGAMQANPVNVQAEYVSPASYFVHTSYDSGTDRILLGDDFHPVGNPWMTQAEWVAQTDAQINQQARRDIDLRVFRPITTYTDNDFPSNPTLRGGGILSEIAYAQDRGMQVLCYEGYSPHIVIPNAWGQPAKDRAVNWHDTQSASLEMRYNLERHTDAGVIGQMVFDEGTGWRGENGCWSWYRDHRGGYVSPKYLVVLNHFNEAAGQLSSTTPHPTVIIRAGKMAGVLGLGNLASSMAGASIGIATTQMDGVLDTGALASSMAGATVLIATSQFSNGTIVLPEESSARGARVRVSASRLSGRLDDRVDIDSFMRGAVVDVSAGQMAGVFDAGAISSSMRGARVYVCADRMDGVLISHVINSSARDARVMARARQASAILSGQSGVATRNKARLYHVQRVDILAAKVPHGTTIYEGQVLGWIEDRLRPFHVGDTFAGFAREFVPGTETDEHGNIRLRAWDNFVRFAVRGSVWAKLLGGTPRVGDSVYAIDDEALTLDNDRVDLIGRVSHVLGGRALVYFEGVGVRVDGP